MKKVLSIALGAVTALILVVITYAMTQPTDYHVERSVTIEAPAAEVYALLIDFRNFGQWSPWEKLDPEMNKEFTGSETGQGAVYAWAGNKSVGEGKMTIDSVVENQQVDITLEFIKPFPSKCKTTWMLVESDGKTTMTWNMDGTNEGFMARLFGAFMDMDKMVRKDFEEGLNSLKKISEQGLDDKS